MNGDDYEKGRVMNGLEGVKKVRVSWVGGGVHHVVKLYLRMMQRELKVLSRG